MVKGRFTCFFCRRHEPQRLQTMRRWEAVTQIDNVEKSGGTCRALCGYLIRRVEFASRTFQRISLLCCGVSQLPKRAASPPSYEALKYYGYAGCKGGNWRAGGKVTLARNLKSYESMYFTLLDGRRRAKILLNETRDSISRSVPDSEQLLTLPTKYIDSSL